MIAVNNNFSNDLDFLKSQLASLGSSSVITVHGLYSYIIIIYQLLKMNFSLKFAIKDISSLDMTIISSKDKSKKLQDLEKILLGFEKISDSFEETLESKLLEHKMLQPIKYLIEKIETNNLRLQGFITSKQAELLK